MTLTHSQDSISTDSSRCTLNFIERSERHWTDSVNSVLQSNSAEALRGLHSSSETRQEEQTYHTGDQELSSGSLPACPSDNPVGSAALSEQFLTTKSSSWSNRQSLLDSTGGQCCESLAWNKGYFGSLDNDGNCSEVSKEVVYAMSNLDSDEEEAYSYILELDHKEAGLEPNLDLKFNTIMDAQGKEFASTFESQRREINSLCDLCETQRQLKHTDVLIRSGDDKSADIRDLEKSSPASDSLLMNQFGKHIPISSTDGHLDLDCSFKMKESIYSDAFNLTHSDAFVSPVKNGLNKDTIREDISPGAVKEGLLDNDHYEQISVLDRRVLDRITGETAVSQRFGLYSTYILLHLKQAMLTGNTCIYLHFCKAPKTHIHYTLLIHLLQLQFSAEMNTRGSKTATSSKLQCVTFFFLLAKNDPQSIFEQLHNQPVFKTNALL